MSLMHLRSKLAKKTACLIELHLVNSTNKTDRVTCLNCKSTPEYSQAKKE